MIRLRPAEPGDCRRIWEWRNEPATRQASFNTKPIPYGVHERWFTREMANPQARLLIVVGPEGREAGYVRFRLEGVEAQVSVSLDPRERGRGFGTAAIRQAVDELISSGETQRVVALVKPDSGVSVRLFERAGFVVSGRRQVGGVQAHVLVRERPRGASLLLRVDAGPSVGLGHLQRCLSLAAALERGGARCVFLTSDPTAVAEWVGRFECERVRGRPEDGEEIIQVARAHGCEAVVVDSYEMGPASLQRLRDAGLFVCAVADGAPHAFPCHVLVNGGGHASGLSYQASAETIRLLGPAYALLRPEFWDVPPRVLRDEVRHLFLMLGGADPFRLTASILETLNRLPGPLTVTVVVGPFVQEVDRIAASVRAAAHPTTIVRAPKTIRDLMQAADLAISAAGQTLFELACVGTPTLAIRVAANQDGQLQAFLDAGSVRGVGRADAPDLLEVLERKLRSLREDVPARLAMSRAGQLLVDGRGALRVAQVILAQCRVWR